MIIIIKLKIIYFIYYNLAYQGDIIPMLKVIVWNIDLICNKKFKFNKSSIIISNKSSYLITPYSSLPLKNKGQKGIRDRYR